MYYSLLFDEDVWLKSDSFGIVSFARNLNDV